MDCHWREKYPIQPDEQLDLAKAMCNKFSRGLTQSDRVEELAELIQHFRQSTAGNYDGEYWNSAKREFGVLCLSEIHDDFLMWSHYSAGHQGVCVGINTGKINKPLMKCRYSDNPPFIDAWNYVRPSTGLFADAARCKASRWAYEREW
jgi:hypothetical protein